MGRSTLLFQVWLGIAIAVGGVIGKLADDDLLAAVIGVGAVLLFGAALQYTLQAQPLDKSERATSSLTGSIAPKEVLDATRL
jgi:hypothetical protein